MYSQRDEEKYIVDICGSINVGRFLDIGAWNAIEMSNTRALYERGWHGVVIEPSPGPVRSLVKEYGTSDRVDVIAALVGSEPGLRRIEVSDDAVSGNTDPAWKESGGFYGQLLVPQITLFSIFAQFGGFQMVSIDTEGTSVDICLELLKTEMLPKCIVVEHNDRFVELTRAAQEKLYRVAYISEENVVMEKV